MCADPKSRLLLVALWVAVTLSAGSSCLELREQSAGSDDPCTRCHGDASRDQPSLQRSAPPFDLKGNRDVSYPGVGAHSIHSMGSTTHAPIACDECHDVPDRVDAPGHLDSKLPAEVRFGRLSSLEHPDARYDHSARTCTNTYCHGAAAPVWTRPKAPTEVCGSCHGLPPKAPHPQSNECAECHGDVIDASSAFVAPRLHVDGQVQVDEPDCNACHGGPDNAAPPRDLSGHTTRSAPGVGAHQVHLDGGRHSRPLSCDECHPVPQTPYDPGHLDGSGVDLVFSGVGRDTSYDRDTLTCSGPCHGEGAGSSLAWTDSATLGCDACHGAPPPPPHPVSDRCHSCHGAVVGPGERITRRDLHIDGVVQVELPTACTACHGRPDGDALGAPPADTLGNTDTGAAGVGAHRAHLEGRGLARVVPCHECHQVPEAVDATGHLDSELPAELRFSGVATAFGAQPVYTGGRCVDSYCHGADFVFDEQPSGGRATEPDWTRVDGSQVTCDGCHGMPPPAPHPRPADDCGQCHRNADGNTGFVRPELHVDGKLTFYLDRQDAERELIRAPE